MTPTARLALLLLVPLAAMAALVASAWGVAVPGLSGRAVLRIELPAADTVPLPSVTGSADRPLVVIDAGHGGHDPGAAGNGLVEKSIVLGIARALGRELEAGGEVRVALTRSDDTFLALEERSEIARRLGADLFISIHADSAGEDDAVTGASIYTLSDKASSEAAARFAARENASGVVNGVDIAGQSDAVGSILVELSQRRTQELSGELARLVLRAAQGTVRFHPRPMRSAGLKVLRAPDVPGILFESGFITNSSEAQGLASPEGQRRLARALADAIGLYFVRRQAD